MLAAAAALGWWALHALGPDKVRLPNGKEINLRQLSYGTVDRFVIGKPWQQALGSYLPTNWSAKLKIPVIVWTNDVDTLVCWVETRPLIQFQHTPTVSIVDAEGNESAQVASQRSYQMGEGRISGYTIASFPRRSQYFFLRVYVFEGQIGTLMSPGPRRPGGHVDFKIKNPARGPFTNWTAEPLPVTRKIGTDEFTLTAFNSGLYATGSIAREVSPAWTELMIDIKSSEQCRYAWRPILVNVSDACGNTAGSQFMGRIVQQSGDRYLQVMSNGYICLQGHLWPDEPAWRVRVKFSPDVFGRTCPEDLWKIKVPVPAGNSFSEIKTNIQLREGSISLLGLSAANVAYAGAPACTNPAVWVKVEPPSHRLILRAADDQRRYVSSRPVNGWPEEIRSFSLQIAPEAKALDLTFLLYAERVVEFLAKPNWVKTNIYRP